MLLYRTKTNDDLDWCVNHGIHNRAKNLLKVHIKGNKFLTTPSPRVTRILVPGKDRVMRKPCQLKHYLCMQNIPTYVSTKKTMQYFAMLSTDERNVFLINGKGKISMT